MSKQITIKQAAEQLGVSTATIYNWIRLGKITDVSRCGRAFQLAADEITRLKRQIASGKLPYLKSRRNKRAVTGRVVPANYVQNKVLIKTAENLVHTASRLSDQGQLLLLLELYLQLLRKGGRISVGKSSAAPLISHWLEDSIDLEHYAAVVKEFWQLCSECSAEDVRQLSSLNQLELDADAGEDLLGLVYMSICSLKQRKNTGRYYTPRTLVQQLIETTFHFQNPLEMESIVDPCCGSGIFLMHIFLFLRRQLLDAGWSEYAAEAKLAEMLIGFEIDPVAVLLTKMNLSLLFTYPELIDRVEVLQRNTLLKSDPRQFDLIIGNPPWGGQFSQSDLQELVPRYKTAPSDSTPESFNLFVEWAVDHVSSRGLISYLLPEAFLTVQFHTVARELLLKTCELRKVVQLGMVFSQVNAPVIALIAENTGAKAAAADLVVPSLNCFVYGDQTDQAVIEHICSQPHTVYLRDNADFALGIVTGDNRRFLLIEPTEHSEPIISGRDLLHYNIKECTHHLVYQREQLQQVAPEKYYRAPEKLVYRFVHRQLVVAYDNQRRLTLNSANIVIPKLDGVSIKYVLAVLNSRVVQFYRMLTNPDVKVLRSFMESIPIMVCSKGEQAIITALVDEMLMSKNPAQRRKIYELIDQKIMDYYCLSDEYQTYIRRKSQTVDLL